MDITIHRNSDGSMHTVWYSKECASNRILNYKSGHPLNTIINVGKNLVRRARLLTTKPGVDVDTRLRHILERNDFPKAVVRRMLVSSPVRSFSSPSQHTSRAAPEGPGIYKSMYYVKGISERMRKLITKTTDVTPAFRPVERIGGFFSKLKDPIPPERRCDVVYRIPCGACDAVYVGTTKQMLRVRVGQHRNDCRAPIRNPEASALCSHTDTTGHMFKFGETEILDTHGHYGKRMMLEALHIKCNLPRAVNKRTDHDGVNVVYASLIDYAKQTA